MKFTKEEFIDWCKKEKIQSSTHYKKRRQENPDLFNKLLSNPQRYENFKWELVTGIISHKDKSLHFFTMEEFIDWCKKENIKSGSHHLKRRNELKTEDLVTEFYYDEIKNLTVLGAIVLNEDQFKIKSEWT